VTDNQEPIIDADELLDAAPEPGRLDMLMDFAYPLPVIVIAELMGVPAEHPRPRNWPSGPLRVAARS
jgi:cytochrome P450 PksS